MLTVSLPTGERCGRARASSVALPTNWLRWRDYIRDAPANQLDDGIGGTFVLDTVE